MISWSVILNLIVLVSARCLQDQENLLLQLKKNLVYDSAFSTKLVKWNESIDCCQWAGLNCDFAGHVTGLDLSGDSISAGIEDTSAGGSLFRFEHLLSLNLAQNYFNSVDLPSGFGKLEDLSYLNLSDSGFSGQIPVELTNLRKLVVLDLSSSFYNSPLRLENPSFKTFIQNFTNLKELHADGVNISADGQFWCEAVSSSLPELQVLSLSNSFLTGPFDSSLAKLRSLSVIRLDGNTFSSTLPDFFADFPNLRILTLSSCNLFGVTPVKLFQIPSLQIIDLSNNRDLEGTLPEFASNASLQNLVCSYTKFSGNLPDSISNLGMLSILELRSCNFSGSIPKTLANLTQIVSLDLSLNQFVGSVPSLVSSKSVAVINLRKNRLTGEIPDYLWKDLENLNFLDLNENLLEGEIPSALFLLPSLRSLRLSSNRFRGPVIDSFHHGSSPLEVLDLSDNYLEGPLPQFLFNLQNLSSLSLSSNMFTDTINLTRLQKLTNLVSLDLSYNNLTLHVKENASVFFPRIGTLKLASCNLLKVPHLKNQSSLMMLDLSNNHLDGEIPNWLWSNSYLRFVNLSCNRFTSLQEPYTLKGLDLLDVHSNMLGGQIPVPSTPAFFLDFSSNSFSSSIPAEIGHSLTASYFFSIANNKVTGAIPSSLCNATRLQVLDLSNNSLSGTIPSCLIGSNLGVVNLRRNRFGGGIPDSFPVTCSLETLDLSWNRLEKHIPESLANCTKLEVLNLGNNKLTGTIPCWLKRLPSLRILELRFNKFHGNISCLGDNNWHSLQIIGLGSNNLNGVLPHDLLSNLKAMMTVKYDDTEKKLDYLGFVLAVGQNYYQDSMTVTFKGLDFQLEKILTIFTSLDFSNNHFHGAVPEEVGELKSLYVLNLSRNAFSGPIPSSMGNLLQLESLDLSFNRLGGQIPNQLVKLTFLSFLNLSQNQLVGRIPQGSQMQTFPESSFHGNKELCGLPLETTCREGKFQKTTFEEHNGVETHEIYLSAGLGFLVGLAVIFGPLLLSRKFREFYNRTVNELFSLGFQSTLKRRLVMTPEKDWSDSTHFTPSTRSLKIHRPWNPFWFIRSSKNGSDGDGLRNGDS